MQVGSFWACRMHPEPGLQSCSAPEAPVDHTQQFIESPGFVLGPDAANSPDAVAHFRQVPPADESSNPGTPTTFQNPRDPFTPIWDMLIKSLAMLEQTPTTAYGIASLSQCGCKPAAVINLIQLGIMVVTEVYV